MAGLRMLRALSSACLGWSVAVAQPGVKGPSETTALSRPEIDRRLTDWTRTNDDPAARFSASAAIAELTAAAQAAEREGYTEALRDLWFLIGEIEGKRQNGAAAVAALQRALKFSETSKPDTGKLVRAHFTLGKAHAAEADYAAAASDYRAAIELAKRSPGHTEDNRLGMQQELGYVLHEAGEYEEALRVNRETLAGGERLHGATDPRLKTVHVNIAQNLHALGRRDEIETHLKTALTMSRASSQIDWEQDMLFQLGVLAFETGRYDDARRWMKERIALLRERKRDDILARAVEDYDELERRIATGKVD